VKPLPVMFAQAQETVPAEQPAGTPQQAPSSFGMFFPLLLVMLFFFVVILPMNRRQRKEQEKAISSVKRGTKVALSSGIVGTVVNAKEGEDEIVVRSEDAKIRVLRSSVAKIIGQEDDKPAEKAAS
jgi:preprotein translocase subunit YajC